MLDFLNSLDTQQIITVIGQIGTLLAVNGAIGIAITPIVSQIKVFLGLNVPGMIWQKRILAGVVSLVGGAVAVYQLGYFLYATWQNLALTAVLTFAGSLIYYKNFFKESDTIKKIEGQY